MAWPLTSLLAIYGAVLSTVVFGWNAWRQWRETGRLWCTFELQYISAENPFLRLRIANVGTRPITVVRIEARERGRSPWQRGRVLRLVGDDPGLDPDDPLPQVLAPAEEMTVGEPGADWRLQSRSSVWVEDRERRQWRIRRAALKHGQELEAWLAKQGGGPHH
jgi:hypothetical protein